MELFSEIYSAYYNAVSKILSKKTITQNQMKEIIDKNAFSESAFYIIPKIRDQWHLVSKTSIGFSSVLKSPTNVELPLTLLEKRWLKAILSDDKISLFLEDKEIEILSKKLNDIEPLYNNNDFFFFDQFNDGDDFKNPNYIKHFRILREAISLYQVLKITYKSPKRAISTKEYIPVLIEYSAKNNKFRVYTKMFSDRGKSNLIWSLNISRIIKIEKTEIYSSKKLNIENFFRKKRCKKPAILEIYPQRNGVERFMVEFAPYEKRTEIDEKTGICTAELWYDSQDETEVLIRLLSYGPILKIVGSEDLKRQAMLRIKRQHQLINTNKNDKALNNLTEEI
ncbi:MAG: WYL domain-containing protein [Clostridiales bacterium]|nr:WYL domain-containing protein [Clostridiales bacterium]